MIQCDYVIIDERDEVVETVSNLAGCPNKALRDYLVSHPAIEPQAYDTWKAVPACRYLGYNVPEGYDGDD